MSTWMVVEDEPDIYEVLLAMFEAWGIDGVAFVDGGEAIAWIDDVDAEHVQVELPDLAILDIRLPEVSGPEIGARLRRSPRLKNIAIVLITAYRLTPSEEDALMQQAQAELLLYKPLPRAEEFRRVLEQARARRMEASMAEAEVEAESEHESEVEVVAEIRVNAEPEFRANDNRPRRVETPDEVAMEAPAPTPPDRAPGFLQRLRSLLWRTR